ncbi:MAG: type II secretion system protein GspG [Planctomycetota bacterium]|nr:type II secretion system protein GspG [Planctomycetota bacterium]
MIHSFLTQALLVLGLQAPTQQAAFHAANVDVLIEASDVAALIKAYEKAPVVQMLNDPGVAKIADVAREMGLDIRAMLQGMLPVVDASKPDDPFWPWSAATAASISMSDLHTVSTGEATRSKFGRGVFVIDFKDAFAAEQAVKAAAGTGGVERDMSAGDATIAIGTRQVSIQRFTNTALGSFWVAQDGARWIVGFGGVAPSEIVARLSNPESSFVEKHKQLVDDTSFQSACGTTLVRAWSQLERLPQGLLPDMSATDASLLNTFVPGFLPFVGQKGRWRMQLCGERFVSESLAERIGDAKQLDALYGTGEIPNSTARMVPKEAVGAWVMMIQPAQFEALLERTLVGMNSAVAVKPDDGAPKISAAVGDSGAMFLLPLSIGSLAQGGGVPAPPAVLAVALKDAAAFKLALDAWIGRAKLAEPKLKVENKPYHKLPMYTFTLGTEPDENGENAEASMKPTITILADRVLVTPNRKTAQAEVRRSETPNSEVHALAAENAIPKGAFEASSMDWGATVGKLYDAGRGLLPMMSQGRDTPIDVEALPTAATLFRFFKPSASYSKRVDGKTYTYSESSFGPEVPLALAMTMMGVSGGARIGGEMSSAPTVESGAPRTPTPSADVQPTPALERESTVKSLRAVRTGIAIYKSQFQRVPNTLDELLKGTDTFPKGFLDGSEVPKDGWGRALVYSVRENGAKYDLRSSGANGVDDQGAVDDVLP